MLRVRSLWVFPVKSLAGYCVDEIELDRFGFSGDRRYMIVNARTGQFVTQRQYPGLCRLQAFYQEKTLVLKNRDEEICVHHSHAASSREVHVWQDTCRAMDMGDEVAGWLSGFLETSVRLVYMPDSENRRVDAAYANGGETVSFADGFPVMLASHESLQWIARRAGVAQVEARFRANIVVEGCSAFEEDHWQRLEIGGLVFTVTKPCSRCVIPSIDPDTGEIQESVMQVLKRYRRRADGRVYLGQNLLYQPPGAIRVGDRVNAE